MPSCTVATRSSTPLALILPTVVSTHHPLLRNTPWPTWMTRKRLRSLPPQRSVYVACTTTKQPEVSQAEPCAQFEELKKKQKGKKGGKKKADKADATGEKDDATAEAPADGEAQEADVDAPTEEKAADSTPLDAEAAEGSKEEKTEEASEDTAVAEEASADRPTNERKPSQSEQSRQRSASFRQNSGLTSPSLSKSSALPSISAEEEVQDIYRKQASRIDELEKENKTLQEAQSKMQKVEDELEQLRESSGDVAELKSKAALADKRHEEIEKLV